MEAPVPNTEIEHAREIAALTATTQAQAREIRDLKKAISDNNQALGKLADELAELNLKVHPMVNSAAKLDRLLTEADRQDGMKTLASKIVGGGLLAAFGAALLGIYNYFIGGAG